MQTLTRPHGLSWAPPIPKITTQQTLHKSHIKPCLPSAVSRKQSLMHIYLMQRTDTTFASLAGMKWFSSLDAARGYHQLPIEEEDRWKTAFTTHHGLFHDKAMPFGLRNAPAIFQRFMEAKILGNLPWITALVYFDDIIVFCKTLRDTSKRCMRCCLQLMKGGFRFSARKCFSG